MLGVDVPSRRLLAERWQAEAGGAAMSGCDRGDAPDLKLLGYFSDADQGTPAHDPGFDVPCAVCGETLTRPCVAHSFLPVSDGYSYFVRACRGCNADEVVDQYVDMLCAEAAS